MKGVDRPSYPPVVVLRAVEKARRHVGTQARSGDQEVSEKCIHFVPLSLDHHFVPECLRASGS